MPANLPPSWKAIRLMSYKKTRIKKKSSTYQSNLGFFFIYTHTQQTAWYNIKTEQTYTAVSNDYKLDRWNVS